MDLRTQFNRRIFEWSMQGKSRFLLFFSCGLMVFNLSTLKVISTITPLHSALNLSHTDICLRLGAVYCAICLIAGLLGFMLPRNKHSLISHVFAHLALTLYNVGNLFLMFMYGILTMLLGVCFSGGLILGLILFGHKKTATTLVFIASATALLFYLYRFGHTQYAYVMSDALMTNNNITWTLLIITATFPHTLCLLYFAGQSTDAWQERENKIINLSQVDPLTQCYNRRFMMTQAEQHIEHTPEAQQSTSFMMVDIDHFKKVNDTYGHNVGDEAIQHIAKILQENIRKADILSRYGGEEFCILMRNCNQDTAKLIAERCRIQIQYTPLLTDDLSITLTASFGVATIHHQKIHEHHITADDALLHADKALYQAKKSGRNKCITVSLDKVMA